MTHAIDKYTTVSSLGNNNMFLQFSPFHMKNRKKCTQKHTFMCCMFGRMLQLNFFILFSIFKFSYKFIETDNNYAGEF